MPLNRLPDVLLSNQTLTGVSADYLDGITSVTFSESLRANRNISGGGNITFDTNGNLYWSNRFIIISNGRGSHYATDGYFDAYVPTSGTINGFGGAATRTATGSGINLSAWDALYVVTPIGGVYSSTSYRIVSHTSDFEVPHNWVLIAVRNGDDGFVYLPNGIVLEPGQTSTASRPGNLKVGTSDTENYIAFRGTTGDNPGGFDHGFIGERIYGGSELAELLIFKGNDLEGPSGPDRIRLFAANHVFDTFTTATSGPFSTIGAATSYTRLIIKQAGSVGIGTTSPDTIATSSTPAMLGIVSNAVGTTNLVLRTIASQTARLQQWQNSAGTVLVEISAGGDLFMSNATRAFFGGSSATGYVNISTAGNGARQGLVIQGSASQTANLQEWQDSTGLIKSYIDLSGNHWIGANPASAGTIETSSGYFYVTSNRWDGSSSVGESFGINNFRFGGAGAAGAFALHLKPVVSSSAYLSIAGDSSRSVGVNVQYPSASSGYGQFGVQIQDSSYKGIVVRGAASQTANLTEWQNSSGTSLVSVSSSGDIFSSSRIVGFRYGRFGNDISYTNDAPLRVSSNGASTIVSVIKGAASQTANLTEWQDSVGTVLAKVDASGYLSTSKINFTGGTSTISALTLADGTVSFESTAGQLFSISNSLTGTIFSVNDISGLPIIESTDAGIVKINELFGQTVFGSGTPTASSLTTFVARTAATIPIVVKGATSQSANLQNWYAGDGTLGTRIGPYGELVGHNQLANGIGGTLGLVMWSVISGNANYIPIVVQGHSSQSADLQRWQNSAATILAKVNYYGGAEFIDLKIGTTSSLGVLSVTPGTTSQKGLVIRGLASQTANLQEWSDSTGTYTASMDQYAQFKAVKLTTSNYITGITSTSANIQFQAGYGIVIRADAAGYMPLVLRGVASQTANLQEWQDSVGTVLAKVTASGGFELNGKDIEIMNIMGAF